MHFIKNDLILIPFCFRIDDDDENGMTNKKKDPIVEKNKERVRKRMMSQQVSLQFPLEMLLYKKLKIIN